ncbi:MAG: DUF3501 family protein [Candidatus Paracaedibacteraceae bacterium]|nr:DUF3501 family protein [Candidatus Paracaedibacteraceae bacterium]
MIQKTDILNLETFTQQRHQWRHRILALKKNRRVTLGEDVTCYFENRETLLWQIQEMLYIEKGGDEQIKDELAAYAPLVPQGNEWVATVMIEIPDPVIRAQRLSVLGHFEFSLALKFAGQEVIGQPENDLERTTADGKTSSVHFIRWCFTAEQKELLRQTNQDVILECRHPQYSHKTLLADSTRQALCLDFS